MTASQPARPPRSERGRLSEQSGQATASEADPSSTRRRLLLAYAPLLSLAAVIGLWEVGYVITGGIGFPSFLDMISVLAALSVTAALWSALATTIVLTVGGLFLGLGVALIVGVVVGQKPFLTTSSLPTINFLRVIPSIVLMPLFLISWGNSLQMIIYLTATVSSFKLIPFVTRGVHDTLPPLRETAAVMRLSWITASMRLYIPAALPSVLTGVRLTVARAYSAVVIVGLTTTGPGIGGQLVRAKMALNTPEVFAYSMVAGIVGVSLFYLFLNLEKLIVFWGRGQ